MSISKALVYEVNKLSGFNLYKPTNDEVNIYSNWSTDNQTHDFVWFPSGKRYSWVKGWPDKQIIHDNLTAGYYWHDYSDDELKKFSLLGLSFLPWNKPVYDDVKKSYIVKQTGGVVYPPNPLYVTENYYTILKLLIPILVLFFGGRYLNKKYNLI